MSVTSQRVVIGTDPNYTPTFSINFLPAAFKFQGALLASIERTMVVPNNVDTAFFSFVPLGVWVAESGTPITIPAGAFTSTEAELNPGVRNVTPGATLRFIASAATEVGVIFGNTKDRT